MKIGILSQWYSPEPGGGTVPAVLARELAKRGHEIQVVTGFPNYPTGKVVAGYRIERKHDEVLDDGVALRRVALYPHHGQSASKRILNYSSFALSASVSGVKTLRNMDAIWVYNSPATIGLPSILTSKFGGPPHLMHVMDLWPDSLDFTEMLSGRVKVGAAFLLNAWCDYTYREASAVAAISRGLVQTLISRGVSPSKVSHVPVWADEEIYFPREKNEALAEKLGVSNKFVILYAGTLGQAQGLSGFLDVCKGLDKAIDCAVLIAGAGTDEQKLRQRVSTEEISNVQFLGQVPPDKIVELLSISDVNLVSLTPGGLSEITTPSKLTSLMASGRPIIAWANGEVANIVTEAKCGLVATPGDINDLENKLLELYAQRTLLTDYGKAARTYYENHFSMTRATDQIEGLLKGLS